MSNLVPCPRCATLREVEVIEQQDTVTINGKPVEYTAHLSRCTVCGEEVLARGQLDANLAAAQEVYARLYESPSPEALVALRAKYNASQKAFGIILGFGELTMNGYEQGGTPDSTNRVLLKIAEDPSCFRALYDINKTRIGAIQRRRIEESEGYREAFYWHGLEALSQELTTVQKAKIEECAEHNQRTVPEQIAFYVANASFQDYSRLMLGVSWHASTSQNVDIKAPDNDLTVVAS